MTKHFILPLLILLLSLSVFGQGKTDAVIGNGVSIHTNETTTIIEIKEGSKLMESLYKIPAFQDMMMAADTPPVDSSKFETVEIKTIESDSGDLVEIIIKDKNGNIKKVVRISEDMVDDYDFDFKARNFIERRRKGNDPKATPTHKNVESKWWSLDIGLNGLMYKGSPSLPSSLSNLELDPLRSVHVNVGIFQQKINLYKHHVGLVYGINYDNNDYRFSNNINLKVNEGGDSITYDKRDPQQVGFDRNKLTTRFLTIPVALRFDFNPNKKRGGHITIGAHAGYRLTSFFKTVRFDEGKRKTKLRDDFLLNNFRYGAYVKVGYGKLNLFANYVITPLFRENTGPELNPFSFGLTFGGY